MVVTELTQAGTVLYIKKFAIYNCKRCSLRRLSLPKIVDSGQCLLKLCENTAGVRNLLNRSVDVSR